MSFSSRFCGSLVSAALAFSAALAPMTSPALAQPRAGDPDYQCDDPSTQTQLDITFCSRDELQREDDRLNELYGRLIPTLSDTAADALTDAQLAWIEYRDAECEFTSSRYEGGSFQSTSDSSCRKLLTTQRADELAEYLNRQRTALVGVTFNTVEQEREAFRGQLQDNVFENYSDRRFDLFLDAGNTWQVYRAEACSAEVLIPSGLERQACQTYFTEQRLRVLEENNRP